MKKPIAIALTAVAALFASPLHAAECGSLAGLRWLLGEWTADGSKSSFHESWTERGPQTFEGGGIERAKADGTVKVGESLRLVEMSGGVYYVSKVTHNELPVTFRLSGCGEGRFVFENPAHDFPKRLEYRREGEDRLIVRVSDGSEKGFTLDFRRVTAAADPAAAVLAAEDARIAAMIAADADALRQALGAELEYVHLNGDVEDREQLIAAITSGSKRYVAVTPIERQVVMMASDAAFIRGRSRLQVVADGRPLDLALRYLAVYRRTDGAWRLVASQSLREP